MSRIREKRRPCETNALAYLKAACTLRPLQFIIVMSAVMSDAVVMLSPKGKSAHSSGDLADLVYADDTLLIGSSPELL